MDRNLGITSLIVLFALLGCAQPLGTGRGGQPTEAVTVGTPGFGSPDGTTIAGVESPTPPPVITVPSGDTQVTLTRADNGSRVVMRSGQRVNLTLSGARDWQWSMPWTSNDRVVQAISASTPGGGAAEGTFLATTRGTAELNAKWMCSIPGCKAGDFVWQVTVLVE